MLLALHCKVHGSQASHLESEKSGEIDEHWDHFNPKTVPSTTSKSPLNFPRILWDRVSVTIPMALQGNKAQNPNQARN